MGESAGHRLVSARSAIALGVPDPEVQTRTTCVDSRRQWRHAGNVWHNSGVRSMLQTVASPFKRMKSQPGG